jgi:hypothetical protein
VIVGLHNPPASQIAQNLSVALHDRPNRISLIASQQTATTMMLVKHVPLNGSK